MSNLSLAVLERNYAQFGLSDNPFPSTGVPDDHPTIYIGQPEVLTALQSVLLAMIATGRSNHLILTGSYGNGKSHTLKFVKTELEARSGELPRPLCIGYVSQPGTTFLDIYREFMFDLGYERIREKAQTYLGRVAYQLHQEGKIEDEVDPDRAWEDIQEGKVLLSDVVPRALERLNRSVQFMDFARAFVTMAYDENSINAWDWLNGSGIDYPQRRQMGLTKNMTDTHSLRAFAALKSVLKEIDNSAVAILIDEFECIGNLQARTRQNMLNAMRHLIDMHPSDLSLVIACAPEIWQMLISDYHAFSDRISKEVPLKPMDLSLMQELVTAYLNQARDRASEATDPFSGEALTSIYELGMGNTRRILTICSQAIEAYATCPGSAIDGAMIRNLYAV
ncbi:MAG TPA: DUF2791 family P-loop domain-containing protein [Methanoregulaceae archaeon]|nr:DUF2791 family P-loop domain-containing protein [Methanoregulaceae archaeon]